VKTASRTTGFKSCSFIAVSSLALTFSKPKLRNTSSVEIRIRLKICLSQFSGFASHLHHEIMATVEEGFKNAVADFRKHLKPEEESQFKFTTLNDLQLAAKDIQEKQRKTKTTRSLTRIQPFLQAMTEYTKVIEVFLNTSSILCFIWGPMKFMLLVCQL